MPIRQRLAKFFLILFVCSNPLVVSAAARDVYPFASSQQAAIFKQVTNELRCLVCQNETLAASNAPLAQDLRQQIYRRVIQGASVKQIEDYVVARYGEFVLFKPRLTKMTYLIWFGPFGLLALGLVGLIVFIQRHRRQAARPLTPAEQVRLQQLLADKES